MTNNELENLKGKLCEELAGLDHLVTIIFDADSCKFVATLETIEGTILETGRSAMPLRALANAMNVPRKSDCD